MPTAKSRKDSNPEFLKLYEEVAVNLVASEPNLLKVKAAIENTPVIKKATKKTLLSQVQGIFDASNAILEKLGELGRVR